jgi:hypothetical protein
VLDDLGSVPSWGNDGIVSLCHHIQTASGAHPASYTVGARGFYPVGKVAGA